MRVCGVICEYNPFHNGHAHQLRRARALSGADYVVCAMSGPFVQRGEPAALDKWTRAEAALRGGADAVIELPALFAVRPAPDFARGGVALLNGLGVTTHLSFGSEESDLAALGGLAAPETPEQSARIREHLKRGLSHPAARAAALGRDLPPNAMLAAEYLRALQALGSGIQPVPVLRTHGHHDPALGQVASATAVRAALRQGLRDDAARALPPESAEMQLAALPHPLPSLDGYSSLLLYLLRGASPEALRQAYAIPEGLEHRLCRAALQAVSAGELLELIRCKRYPTARLRRLLVQLLLGHTAALQARHPAPEYARVLGFRAEAAPLLRAVRRSGALPLVVKAADAPGGELWESDLRAQDVWDLLVGHPARRDLTERLRILRP